jgi:hypothetical protein
MPSFLSGMRCGGRNSTSGPMMNWR